MVYLVHIREIIMDASRAGLVKWEPTDQPPAPFKTYNGGTTLRGFRANVNGVIVETIVTQKNPKDPTPGEMLNTDNFAFGLRISDGVKVVTYTTDPKVIPGDTSAELVHGMDQRPSFAMFCKEVQYLVEGRSLVNTLHSRLLSLFHPA